MTDIIKENVNIFIEGIVRAEDEDRITSNVVGEYRIFEGVHILKYKDSDIEDDSQSKNEAAINTIKISSGMVEMIKSGENSTHMTFDLNQDTESVYDTPYGGLMFQIKTTKIKLEEEECEIILHMEYTLSHNDSHISDNKILILAKRF